ncbi:hypothetical protein [Sinomonas humi]|nr:hypothetical protein [Sinomonas humi]
MPSSDARTARDSAIVRAARAGVSAHRLAEAIGLTDSDLERIIAEDLCR